jgi:hypothetical protein
LAAYIDCWRFKDDGPLANRDAKLKRTNAELEEENRTLRAEIRVRDRFASSQGIVTAWNQTMRYGTICFCAWVAGNASIAMAGKETNAKFAISLLGQSAAWKALAIIFGGGGTIYGLAERRTRKRNTEQFEGRIRKYEEMHDPNRSSSNLTRRGDTRPADN